MAIISTDIAYAADGRRYLGYLARDEAPAGARPAVLVAPSALGVVEHVKRNARRLAELGYVALVIDYYGDGATPGEAELIAQMTALEEDRAKLRVIAAAALGALAAQPEADPARLAGVGY